MGYICKKCGSEVSEDSLFCCKCGEKVVALRCPKCGKRLPGDSLFCTFCGMRIDSGNQPVQEQPSRDASSVVENTDASEPVQNKTGCTGNVEGETVATPIQRSTIGEYSYDGSFETPDGTWANFYYALSIEDANNGVAITEIWRGIYTFCNDWASQNDLEGNTLYFVVKYGENAGTHSLTYVPAVQSPYGADTIYIDGNTDMPYTRDSYSTDGSYDSDYSYSADEYILPTDTQYITESDLYGMSKERVSLARNEIYARYGYSFQNAGIRNYFLQQSWYYENPSINANTFGINNLSDCERANLETIQQYERDMGWK